MKVLVITASEPPHQNGGQHGAHMRTRTFMHALERIAAEVDIVYYVNDPENLERSVKEAVKTDYDARYWGLPIKRHFLKIKRMTVSFTNEYLKGILYACQQPELYSRSGSSTADELARIVSNSYDIIIVRSLAPMVALLPSLSGTARAVIFDLDDVQHLVKWRWSLSAPLYPGKLLKLAQIPALFASEYRAALKSYRTIVCSEQDRCSLTRKTFPRVVSLPNAIPLPKYQSYLCTEPHIMFIGLSHYGPNAQAIERLVTRIFPLIRARKPDAKLLIAGESSDRLRGRWNNDQNIEFLGFVSNLDTLYANTRIVVCPLMNGGGTRIKLIEAAARGIPIVATAIGAEGLAFVNKHSILIEQADVDFAAACIHLIESDEQCERLRKMARTVVENTYDESMLIDQITEILQGAIE